MIGAVTGARSGARGPGYCGTGRGAGLPAGFATAVAAALAAALTLGAAPLAAQEVQAVLGADSARVGDVVPVAMRVTVGAAERVIWPDTLPLAGSSLENAARVRERVDTLADGRLARTAVWGITPWRTGELALPDVAVQVVGGDESPRTARASLPTLTVVSVLPPDTAGLEPRPARGVLGPNWAWGPIAALALLLAGMLAALFWWWRRRQSAEGESAPLVPAIPPRERALAELQEARDAGLLERGEVKEFYVRFSEAVRNYAAALDPAWGEDLTTTELVGRLRAHVGVSTAAELRNVLVPADRVKFARRVPDRETALAEWEAARAWVVGFDGPPPRALPVEAAA